MRWPLLALLLCAACRTEARKRHEVEVCRSLSRPVYVSACLMDKYDWEPQAAATEGARAMREAQRDSAAH